VGYGHKRIEPGNPTVLNNLGSTRWALGDTARAAAYYERALRAAPGSAEVIANLARLRGIR
jgi:Flp pilus assembly protein TadD